MASPNHSGRAFRPILCSGVRIPIYTNFAAGFRELARLALKISAVQMPAVLAWSMVCGALITHLMGLPVINGVIYGLRGGCLLFGGRFIFLVLGFSSNTNDSTRFRVPNLAIIVSMILLGGAFLGLSGVGLMAPKPLLAWSFTALALVEAYVFFRIYGWFYGMNFFDLMSPPRR